MRADGDVTVVEHRLLAREQGCDTAQRFGIAWRLQRDGATWKVAGLRGTALSEVLNEMSMTSTL